MVRGDGCRSAAAVCYFDGWSLVTIQTMDSLLFCKGLLQLVVGSFFVDIFWTVPSEQARVEITKLINRFTARSIDRSSVDCRKQWL